MPEKNNSDQLAPHDKLEAINALLSMVFEEARSEEDVECQGCQEETEEEPVTVVPVVETINSIIARSLMYIDKEEIILEPEDLLILANLSHVIQKPSN